MIRVPTILFLVVLAVPVAAQETVSAANPVWVNLGSGVYHCPGTEHYGTTSRGEYLPEATAIAQGYKARDGQRCSTLPGAEPTVAGAPISTLLPDSGPKAPTTGLADCLVVMLKDGDTIQCKAQGPVRLIGIDTPERDQVPFGTAATAGMAALLPAGVTVQITLDQTRKDRFGRLLAYAWYQGASVNWLMIRLGWAVSVRYPPNTRYAEWFDKAEARAKTEQRGLWRVGGFSCRPSQHRAGVC